MDPLTISIWAFGLLSVTAAAHGLRLSSKIKKLKQNQSVEEKERQAQMAALESRAVTLKSNLDHTEKDLARAKREVSELKDNEARLNTQVRQLKQFSESVTKERDGLVKETANQQKSIARYTQQLEKETAHASELQEVVHEKEKYIHTLQNARRDMTKKIQELETNIESISRKNDSYKESISRQEQHIAHADSERLQLERLLREKDQAIQKFHNARREMTAKIEELNVRIETTGNKNDAYQQTLARQKRELEDASCVRKELAQRLRNKEEDIQKYEDDARFKNEKIVELETSAQALEQKISVYQQTIESLHQELAKISAQRQELRDSLAEKEETAGRMNAENNDMREKIVAFGMRIEGLEKETVTNQETIKRQQQELESLGSQRSDLATSLREKEQYIERLEVDVNTLKQETEELKQNVEAFRNETDISRETILHQQEVIQQTSRQRSDLQGAFEDVQNNNQQLVQRASEFESYLQNANNENSAKQEIINRFQAELESALKDYSQAQASVQEKEQHIKEIEKENHRLLGNAEELTSNLAALHKEQEARQKALTEQQDQLQSRNAQYTKLQNSLQDIEQNIQKLKEANYSMTAKLKEAHSQIQGLERKTQAQSVIMAELRKEYEGEGEREAASAQTTESSELELERQRKGEKLAQVLLENELITDDLYQKALFFQQKFKNSLLRFLFVNRELNEHKLVECLSLQFKVPYIPLGMYEISDKILELLPSTLAQEHWMLPVDKVEDKLIVTMVDPFDVVAIKEIERLTGYSVQAYIGLFSEIAERVKRFYKMNLRGLDAQGNPISPLFIKTPLYKGRERRRAARFKKELPIKAIDNDHLDFSVTDTVCVDGISFALDHEMPMYSTLTLQLTIPSKDEQNAVNLPVMALAQVARVTPINDTTYMIGARLIKIPQEDLNALVESVSIG